MNLFISLFDFGGKSLINANSCVSVFLCTNICFGSKIFALVAQQSEPQITLQSSHPDFNINSLL